MLRLRVSKRGSGPWAKDAFRAGVHIPSVEIIKPPQIRLLFIPTNKELENYHRSINWVRCI